MGMIAEMAIMRIMEVMQIMATGIRAITPKGGARTGYMCVDKLILYLTRALACVLRVLLTNPTFRLVCPRATGFISRWGKLNFDICEANRQIKAGALVQQRVIVRCWRSPINDRLRAESVTRERT